MTLKKYPKLPAKYYLDKHFFPLADQLTNDIKKYYIKENIEGKTLRDIVLDVLLKLKPTYKEAKRG